MKKVDFIVLFLILLIATILRLYKINSPLADFHSWRQVDTAAVSKNFVNNGFDLLHPKYDDLSNVQSGLDNPQGYRMVEFPIYNAIFAFLYKVMPFFSLVVWGRLTSIFFSLIIIGIIYYLSLKEVSRKTAIFASLIYAIFPYFVFFSRVILPETTALSMVFISIFFLYINPSSIIFIFLSGLFYSLSILIKPTAIFYGLALFYIFFKKTGLSIFKKPTIYLYFFLTILPLFLWRNYIKLFPEGIPVSEWLITSVNTGGQLQNIFFKPAFFRWIFFERINNLILGGYLTVFFFIGALLKQKRFLLHSLLISAFTFIFIFQGGNVQHEYYQTLILPVLAIFIGIGMSFFLTKSKNFFSPIFLGLIIIITISLSWFFSYYKVRDFYNYSSDLIQMAKIINSLTLESDKIVTDQTGDTTLLYLANRRGAPSVFKEPWDLKALGYTYLTTSSQDMINKMIENNYKKIFQNNKLSIFAL